MSINAKILNFFIKLKEIITSGIIVSLILDF